MFDKSNAVDLLSALAHEARLEAFRVLVRAGPDGLSAGVLAEHLDLRPTAASFHLGRLRQVGLVRRRRAGQQLIYAANFDGLITQTKAQKGLKGEFCNQISAL